MERSLLWSALGVGVAGWLSALLLTGARSGEPRGVSGRVAGAYWGAAIAVPIVLFFATLPSKAPFAEGQGFGRGFLLGAVGALLGFLAVVRAGDRAVAPGESALRAAAPLFLAVAATAVALLLMPAVIIDALVSLAIGWLATGLILRIGSAADDPAARSALRPFAASAVFAATLAATAALGVFRGSGTLEHFRWAAAAVTLGAVVPLIIVLSAVPGRLLGWLAMKLPLAAAIGRLLGGVTGDEATRALLVRAWRILLTGVLVALAGWLIGSKVLGQSMVLRVVGVGLAMGLLAWWLVRDAAEDQPVEGDAGMRAHKSGSSDRSIAQSPAFALASLVILAGFMAAYRYLQGFGVGLALIAAWPLAGIGLAGAPNSSDKSSQLEEDEGRSSSAVSGLLALGAILVLLRLFQTRFAHELRGVMLTDDYAMVGVLVGALLPGIVAGFQSRGTLPPWLTILRLALSGALLLVVPAGIVLLWGSKCALALLIGLALSAALAGWQSGFALQKRVAAETTLLFALATALALTQWLDHALPLASLARAAKIGAVGWTVAALFLVVLLADYASRLLAARARSEPAGARK